MATPMVESGCHRDSESEGFGFGGDYNVWIRADRDHRDHLLDRLGYQQSVGAEVHSTVEFIGTQFNPFL
jgi:hypothetical protein